MTANKASLRAALRARRAAAAGTTPAPAPAAFAAILKAGTIVATYAPTGREADPAALNDAARAAGCALALPLVVDRATPLRFLAWREDALLAAGPYGFANPRPDWPAVVPDVILTPLVGFDRRGHRLGQGAGHYDRAFAAFPDAWRVGIAWAMQEIDAVPLDPWDLPLHAVATEREWIVPA